MNSVRITTEIELACQRLDRRRTIAITGTTGKSTTASLTAHLLRASGRRCHLGGNIGGSMLEMLDAIEPGDAVVLELSSFQLHWLGDRVAEVDRLILDDQQSFDHARGQRRHRRLPGHQRPHRLRLRPAQTGADRQRP